MTQSSYKEASMSDAHDCKGNNNNNNNNNKKNNNFTITSTNLWK